MQVNGNAQHSLIVVDKKDGEIFMAAHTNNREHSPLADQDEYWKDGVPDSSVSYSIIRLTQYK